MRNAKTRLLFLALTAAMVASQLGNHSWAFFNHSW